jgi:hypothetical protein
VTLRASHATVAIVHRVPGRLRVRVPPGVRPDGLSEAVGALDGVTAVTWSPRTRGLLVLYEREALEADRILATIVAHAGVSVESAEPAATRQSEMRPTLAATVTEAFRQVDGRISRATGGALTLGVLAPVALTVWAGRELLRGRAAPLAWSSALWYAHGLFRDYNTSTREG